MGGKRRHSGPLPLTRRHLIGGMAAGALAPAVVRSAPLGSAGRTVVVGAGVFGAWTAKALMDLGQAVTLIDMAGPAHARASSGGESRMTRAGYGKDEIYTRMALASLASWKQLSARAGLPIFHPHGVLFFFPDEHPYFRATMEVHGRLGLPTEALDRAAMQRRFPMIDFEGVAVGLFEPGFGALMARRGVQTLVAEMIRDGLAYVDARAAPVPMPRGPSRLGALRTADGRTIAGDRFVFALGPWLPKVFPDLLDERIVATRQEVFFFASPAGDDRFGPAHLPGWADFNGGDLYYGFPDLEARGVKFARDTHGVEVDPDTQSRRPTEAALADILAFRDRRFPLLRGAPLTEARVCQYENSSSGDFLIDHHPALDDVILVGGGSGHGFKHGPEVGRRAAALVLGARQDEPRFTLATKERAQKRAVI